MNHIRSSWHSDHRRHHAFLKRWLFRFAKIADLEIFFFIEEKRKKKKLNNHLRLCLSSLSRFVWNEEVILDEHRSSWFFNLKKEKKRDSAISFARNLKKLHSVQKTSHASLQTQLDSSISRSRRWDERRKHSEWQNRRDRRRDWRRNRRSSRRENHDDRHHSSSLRRTHVRHVVVSMTVNALFWRH